MRFFKISYMALVIVCCCMATLTVFAGTGATLDGYTIRVTKGAPPAVPDILAKGETGTFHFAVSLSHNGVHVEALPSDMSLVYRVTSPDGTVITKVLPGTYLFPPTPAGVQNIKAKVISSGNVDSSVSAEVEFFNLVGKQSVSLQVTLIRNSDSNGVADSESIEINIVEATLTIYACPPPIRNKILNVRHFYGDVGHSFGKIGIDPEALSASEDINLPQFNGKKIANHMVGFYPKPDMKEHLRDYVRPVDGIMSSDDGHDWYSSKVYSIKVNDAKTAIQKVAQVDSDKYVVININGKNCTSQSSVIASAAGCNPPNGNGIVHYHAFNKNINIVLVRNNVTLWGPGLLWSCPNPYIHGIQISELQGAVINHAYNNGDTSYLY